MCHATDVIMGRGAVVLGRKKSGSIVGCVEANPSGVVRGVAEDAGRGFAATSHKMAARGRGKTTTSKQREVRFRVVV